MLRKIWKMLWEKITKKFSKEKEKPKIKFFFRPIGNYQLGFPPFIQEKMTRKSMMEEREKVYLKNGEYIWGLEISFQQAEDLGARKYSHLRFIIYCLYPNYSHAVEIESRNKSLK